MSDIGRRKRDHIDIVMSGVARHAAPAGFDDIHFMHNALPEVDYANIDVSTEFLGRRLKLPFLASSMTGGPDVAERVNRTIAEAAQAMGFAMGVGSQRISLTTSDRHGLGPELRRIAPDIPIYGNLGAVQLVAGMGLEEARRAVGQLGADALILHLNNSLQILRRKGRKEGKGNFFSNALNTTEVMKPRLLLGIVKPEDADAVFAHDIIRQQKNIVLSHRQF